MSSPPIAYFYNYYNYDSVSYPLIRLYGKWFNSSGTISVRNNGVLLSTEWQYKNETFKVFVKLSEGENIIILRDNNTNTKTITLYYDRPASDSTSPILKLYLYDAIDGNGSCDAPPSRFDNTLNDNIKRLQLDALLLQSFFAEAYRAARESQEGIKGLPFTTFNLELDLNGTPIVHYLKSRNPTLTREYFWKNGSKPGVEGLFNEIGIIKNSNAPQKVFCLGFTLVSHKDPDTGKYGGGAGDGYTDFGIMNSANLIWHAKELAELQDVFDNTTPIDLKYNQEDNASTVSASYARILGSLCHELCHHTVQSDHPDQIIYLTNKNVNPTFMNVYGGTYSNPLSYFFPFDVEQYPNAFGIDSNDATNIRDWFMPYNTNNTLISYSRSELGPSGQGWFSPFVIQGYINTMKQLQTDSRNIAKEIVDIRNINSTLPPEKKLHNASTRLGFVNSDLLRPHPDYEYPQNSWSVFPKGYYKIKAPSKPTYCIAHIWGSGGGAHSFTYAADFDYIKTMDPNGQKVYLPNTIAGGSGGYVYAVFPVNANDELQLIVGDRQGRFGGGGEPYLQTVYYGGFGGGKSSILINNLLIAVAGGGGGGSYYTPGLSVGQTTPYTVYNGKNGFLVTGNGDGGGTYISSGGGGGYYGGTIGSFDKNLKTASFGGGAGSSFVSAICSKSILKNGIPTTKTIRGTSHRSILPSLFMSSPPNVGSPVGDGCIILNFVYVSESRWNRENSNKFPLLANLSAEPINMNDSKTTSDVTVIPRVKTINNPTDFIVFDKDSTTIIQSTNGTLSSDETTYLSNHISIFSSELLNLTGISTVSNSSANTKINFVIDKTDTTLFDTDTSMQYYKYRVLIQNTSPQVTVTASSIAGLAHGTATLLQLIRSNGVGDARLGTFTISDYSDTNYSSILIDPARDPTSFIRMKELIDLCRFYKIRFLHIHGTDDQGWRFYLNPSTTDFTYNGVNYSLNILNHQVKDINKDWYGDQAKWIEFNSYAESRGVSIVPEIEYLGHSTFIRNKLPSIVGTKSESIDHTKEEAYIAITKIIDQLCITFPNTPYIYIGTDEAKALHELIVNPDPNFYILHPQVPKNNYQAIVNFFIFRVNNYIQSKGKKMITWENNNVDAAYANTNKSVIAQMWLINGGTPGPHQDKHRFNIHGSTFNAITNGVSVIQSPWWPRTFSPMKNMFDWNPIASPLFNQIGISGASKQIPLSSKVLGSCTLLWETHPHMKKLTLLRYKAPIRNENTYGLNRNTTSISTFSRVFDYLDSRFSTYLSGFRVIEKGLSRDLGDLMISYEDETFDPVLRFSKVLQVGVEKARSDISVRYLISGTKELYENLSVSNSILYTEPIVINGYDGQLVNGFVGVRFQAFIGTNPFGRIVEKYYICIPFQLEVNGVYKNQPIDSSINLNTQNRFWFDTKANIKLKSKAIDGTVRFNFIRNKLDNTSPELPLNSEISITNTVDRVFIALFDTNNIRFGGVYTALFISNKDNLIPDTVEAPFPTNTYTVSPSISYTYKKEYRTSINGVVISTLLPPEMPDTVKITAIVVGGGGTNSSGGIARQVYYDVPKTYLMNIEVGLPGQKSSLFFDISFPLSPQINKSYVLPNDRDDMKAYQSPLYPTIAYNGLGSEQGMITKGDLIVSTVGYTEEGTTFGAPGTQGVVILYFEA